MSSFLETTEQLIVAQIGTVPYLTGNVRGAADVKTFLDLALIAPPAAIVVFDGERAMPDQTIGHVLQQTTLFWTVYLIAASFSPASEGRLGDSGAYQMIDDVVTALEGFGLDSQDTSKLLLVSSARYNLSDTAVIYAQRWRHQGIRQEQP